MEQSVALKLLNPYGTLRRGQALIASKVGEAYLESKVLALQYPPGTGKTLAVLLGVLEAGVPRVLYLARTRSQFQAPIREIKRLRNIGIPISAVTLVNKKELCILTRGDSLDYKEFLRYCRIKRKSGLCPFAYTFPGEIDTSMVLDASALRRAGLMRRVCPFALAWRALGDARVIVASYPYIFDEKLLRIFLERSGIDLKSSLLVVDEAHNLPRLIIDFSKSTLSEVTLLLARRELSLVKQDSSDAATALRVIDGLLKTLRKRAEKGSEVEVAIDDLGGYESFSRVFFQLAEIYEGKIGMPSNLWRVAEFLRAVESAGKDHLLYTSARTGENQLVLVNLNTSKLARRVFSSFRSAVLMSATLPPNEYLVASLGFDEKRILRVEGGVSKDSLVKATVVRGISSRFSERTFETYKIYGELINRICSLEGVSRVLAVFPSYAFLTNVYPFVKVYPKIRERPETSLADILDKIAGLRNFLLMVVAWGKFSEGIELRILGKNLIDTVVVAGLPVPEPSLENIKFMERLRDRIRDDKKAWDYTFFLPAVFRIIQAIGRGLRSERDRPRVFILDERLERGEAEEYMKRLGIDVHYVNINEILGELK